MLLVALRVLHRALAGFLIHQPMRKQFGREMMAHGIHDLCVSTLIVLRILVSLLELGAIF